MEDLTKMTREELREKMCELQDESRKYRDAIDLMDKKKDEEYRASIHNKCYRKGSTWFRVEKFDESFRPVGTCVECLKDGDGDPYCIYFQTILWEDDIKEASEVTPRVFNIVLKKAGARIKYS